MDPGQYREAMNALIAGVGDGDGEGDDITITGGISLDGGMSPGVGLGGGGGGGVVGAVTALVPGLSALADWQGGRQFTPQLSLNSSVSSSTTNENRVFPSGMPQVERKRVV